MSDLGFEQCVTSAGALRSAVGAIGDHPRVVGVSSAFDVLSVEPTSAGACCQCVSSLRMQMAP